MPEGESRLASWRDTALTALAGYLRDYHGARALTPSELTRFAPRRATNGWRLQAADYGLAKVELDIIVDGNYPFSQPRIAPAGASKFLEWPHTEEDGVLCLLPGQATISPFDPVAVAEVVVGKARNLITTSLAGENQDDFKSEFLSYWNRTVSGDALPFISLTRCGPPSRIIQVWRGKKYRICADDRATITGWLDRWGAERTGSNYPLHEGIFLWMQEPLIPAEYPTTAAQLLDLSRARAADAVQLLEQNVAVGNSNLEVLLAAPTKNGTCFCGVTVRPPSRTDLSKGFRPGHVPHSLMLKNYYGATNKLIRARVDRADHEWIHGRGHDDTQGVLKKKRVLVLGCGALGAETANLLAQSGVGGLTLVDHQQLEWPNISRHSLGAQSVRGNKARELAEKIRKQFPHLTDVEALSVEFGISASALINDMRRFDVVLSATGDWQADACLNTIQHEKHDYPPVVYAWLEPRAAAAHALLLAPSGQSCLQCGFSDLGRPLLEIIDWPQGENVYQEPACGAVFSPFGAVELSWAHSLTAELIIDTLLGNAQSGEHRIWINRRETIERAGGSWSEKWCREIGNPGNGGTVVRRNWPVNESCRVCGGID